MAVVSEMRRLGRRGEALRRAVLDAAIDEIVAGGADAATVLNISRRAGVHETSVYRRWQTRENLILEALLERSGLDIPAPDTGSLRGDLCELAGNLFRYLSEPAGWATLRITIDTAGASEALGAFSTAVIDVQVEHVDQIVRRAIDRGEAPAGTDANALAECLYGAVTMQPLAVRLGSITLTDEEVDERSGALVDLVLGGVLR